MTAGRIIGPDAVQFERLLPGTVEEVWAFLTDPRQLAQWLASAEFEAWIGGKITLHWNVFDHPSACDGEETTSHGTVLEYDPPRRLSFTWKEVGVESGALSARKPPSVVTIELRPHGGGVLLTLTHTRLAANDVPGTGAGWHTHLDILESRLSGGQPPDFVSRFDRVLQEYVDQVAVTRF